MDAYLYENLDKANSLLAETQWEFIDCESNRHPFISQRTLIAVDDPESSNDGVCNMPTVVWGDEIAGVSIAEFQLVTLYSVWQSKKDIEELLKLFELTEKLNRLDIRAIKINCLNREAAVEKVPVKASSFDFDFAKNKGPIITIKYSGIILNRDCHSYLNFTEYVKIGIDEQNQQLVIAPATEDDKNKYAYINKDYKRKTSVKICSSYKVLRRICNLIKVHPADDLRFQPKLDDVSGALIVNLKKCLT